MKSAIPRIGKPLSRLEPAEIPRVARKLTAGGRLPTVDAGWFAPIDHSLNAEPALSDLALNNSAALLLTSWADVYLSELRPKLSLLDGMRRQFADANQRYSAALIEQFQLDGSELIHRDEVAAGWYELQWRTSNYELRAQWAWSGATARAYQAYKDVLETPGFTMTDFHSEAAQRAWLSTAAMMTPYWKSHKDQLTHPTQPYHPRNFAFALDPIENPGPYMPQDPTGAEFGPRPVYDWVYSLSQRAYSSELASYQSGFASQLAISEGALGMSTKLLAAKLVTARFNYEDVDFRRRRSELTLAANDLRRSCLSSDNGPSNWGARLMSLKTCFVEELVELLSRAISVRSGLEHLWGWSALPEIPLPESWDDSQGPFLDAIWKWMIEVERRVASELPREESITFPLSIRALIGEQKWQEATENIQGSRLTVRFSLPESAVESYWGIRLRGVSCYAVGMNEANVGVWRGELHLPRRALVSSASGRKSEVFQPGVASELGRISTRSSPRPADVAGTSRLRNRSPISWSDGTDNDTSFELSIFGPSSSGANANSLSDVSLDLFMSGYRYDSR
ncbi:hypothetical protein AB4059_13420 [Lysobacter sp. 2RAF19]